MARRLHIGSSIQRMAESATLDDESIAFELGMLDSCGKAGPVGAAGAVPVADVD